MAWRRSLLRDVPPSPDSSEEDIDIDQTSKGTSDSDEETFEAAMELQPTAPALKQSSVSKKKDRASASYSQPTKAIALKPAKSKQAGTPEKPSLGKRSREAEDSKRAKKKKSSEAVDGGRKNSKEEVLKKARGPELKKLFERLWSEENEIAILKGMIEYAVKNNVQPEKLKSASCGILSRNRLALKFPRGSCRTRHVD